MTRTTTALDQALDFIVFFDGHCSLCQGFVRFILRHERNSQLKFCSLQSNLSKRLLSQVNPSKDSVYIMLDGRLYSESAAFLKICDHLRWPFKALKIIRFIPKVFRDKIYRLVARNRYKVFGRSEQCYLPPPEIRFRFPELNE